MKWFLRYKASLLASLLLGLTACSSTSNQQATDTPDSQPLQGAIVANEWQTAYDGEGEVAFSQGAVTLTPRASTDASETHAALALSSDVWKDFHLSVRATTLSQLRTASPNDWEVFWIFFNYIPVGDLKETNYFILKTSGIELGKAYDDVGQTFLITEDSPALTIGQEVLYELEKQGTTLTISIDGTQIATYTDASTSERTLYDVEGSIGLYTEDASVEVTSVTLTPL